MEALPRLMNGLAEPNKMKRCANYKQLNMLAKNEGESFSKKDAFDIIRSCLKGFEDPSERCREEAIAIVGLLLSSQDANILDWVLPSIVTRIGVSPVVEESEEIRLCLLRLSSQCLVLFPHDVGPKNYMDFFQVLLENCLADDYPELKKESCRMVEQLCAVEPQLVKPITVPLALAVRKSCLLHKHSSVRAIAANTLATLIKHGPPDILSGESKAKNSGDLGAAASNSGVKEIETQLYILVNDHSESVRIAALQVLTCVLLDVKERLEYHRKYVPLVLMLVTDSFSAVQEKALALVNDIGKLYMLDNEDNRIDLSSRRVTLKDIEWYGDDEYPDMGDLQCLSLTEWSREASMEAKHSEKGTMNKDELDLFLKNDGAAATEVVQKSDVYKVLRSRPGLGARYAVAESTRGFLDPVLEDIVAIDWVIPFSPNNRRVVALRLLWVTIFYNEKSSVQFTEHILSSLYKALRDESNEVRREATTCVEILGKFLTPDQYLPFLIVKKNEGEGQGGEEEETMVMKSGTKIVVTKSAEEGVARKQTTPTLFSTAATSTKCSILTVLSYFSRSSKAVLTSAQATQVVVAITSDDLIFCETEELLLSLLDCLDRVCPVFAEKRFIPSSDNPLPEEVRTNVKQRTLDSILFYALLRVKACPLVAVQQAAVRSIATLSNTVTDSEAGIYELHAARLLARYAHAMPAAAFADLVLTSVSIFGEEGNASSSTVVLVFCEKLGHVDFTIKVTDELRYFTVLEQLLAKKAAFSGDEVRELLLSVILPLGNFQPGRVAHLFRKVAVNCICALSHEFYRSRIASELEKNDASLADKILLIWCSASDSDDGEMRLACVSVFAEVCQFPCSAGTANDIVQSYMLRLDDSSDTVRLRNAEGLRTVLQRRTSVNPLLLSSLQEQMVPLVKKLLIYMDDPNDLVGIRPVLKEVLVLLGGLSPHIVMELTRAAKEKHRDPTNCSDIMQAIESTH